MYACLWVRVVSCGDWSGVTGLRVYMQVHVYACVLGVYSMQHWCIELSANYKDDIVLPALLPPALGTTMCRCGTSMGQWWRGVESSTAILIPISPTTRQPSVWSLLYCLAAPVRSARLTLSLSESFWCFLNSTCLMSRSFFTCLCFQCGFSCVS